MDAEAEENDNLFDLPPDFWENGVVEWRQGNDAVSLRLDGFILDYFERCGPGYQSRINAVLRSFVLAKLLEEARANERAQMNG